ncbi:MAG: polysaccharide deacetylase family protein [Anaerolineae bacterium]|nr:polysaccharide deacetylase family protein [Anaerolineae bacterium]MDW8098777.1 polysaccharide deacetylase family protein [Anaerolineae bacterium]
MRSAGYLALGGIGCVLVLILMVIIACTAASETSVKPASDVSVTLRMPFLLSFISSLATITPSPTLMPIPTLTPTPSPTMTPTSTPSPTMTPTPTPTLTSSPTITPTSTPTLTPSLTPTPTPTFTPTPGPTPDGVLRIAHVPILMYHYISAPPPDADRYRRDLSVPPDRFESHLRYLQEHGYTSISLSDLVYHLTRGTPLPSKPIILTFDDGYVDQYTNAFPLLRKYGFRAAFFVITDFVTEERPGYMTWEQLKELVAAGMEIGSHSRNHPNLRGQPLDYLVWQALGSKEAIEYYLGITPRFIAYPSGQYDDQTIAVFHSAHFWAGLTITQGTEQRSDRLFELQRIRMRGRHTADDLDALLHLDW